VVAAHVAKSTFKILVARRIDGGQWRRAVSPPVFRTTSTSGRGQMFFGTQLFFGQLSIGVEVPRKRTQCPRCGKPTLIVMADGGRTTTPQCIRCDTVDPLKTDAVKWANSSLKPPE
jgi:ribosomal protein S27AE